MSHTLTPEQEQARGELMSHLARKPKSHDAFDLEAWHDRKAVLEAALAKAMGGPPAPQHLPPDVPRNPKPKEATMPTAPGKPGHLGGKAKPGPKPGAPPQERLDAAVAAYHACEDSKAKKKAKARIYGICSYTGLPLPVLPDGRKAASTIKAPKPRASFAAPVRVYDSEAEKASRKPGDDLIYVATQKCDKALAEMHEVNSASGGRWEFMRDALLDRRSELRSICDQLGRPMPKLPPIPRPPAQVAPPPQMQEPTVPQPEPSSGLDRSHELAIDLGRSIERYVGRPEHLAAIRATISDIRAKTWSLLAVLENLTPEQLAELGPELGMMDEAAHLTTRLAERSAA